MAVAAEPGSTRTPAAVESARTRRGLTLPFAMRVHLPRLTDRAVLLLLLIGVGIAGWPSLSTLLPEAGGDTPLSFVPLVPFIGAVFLMARCDGMRIRSTPRDGFVDGLSLLLLASASFVVLLVLPTSMSWYYWLDRLDILGLIFVLASLIVIVWGLPGVARLGPGLLYLLLAWPLPYLQIYNKLIPPLTAATAMATRAITPLLPLGIRSDTQSTDQLLIPFHGQLNHIVIAQECSGINGALGLVVVGLPLALLGRGTWEARVTWLALGLGLSWLVNLFRISVIAAGVAIWGPDVALNWLHPVLGLILFAISFGVLLGLAGFCRLDITAPFRASPRRAIRPPALAQVTWKRWVIVGATIGMCGLLESNLNQFGWLSESKLPRIGTTSASDLFQPPPGWRVVGSEPIDGWQPLFGPASISKLVVLRGPVAPLVFVQAVLTKDISDFNTYGVEQCYLFHGYSLNTVQHVALGNGVTATLIDFRQDAKQRSASLYWVQPVQTPSGTFHERIVIGTDVNAFKSLKALPITGTIAGATVVTKLSDSVMDILSPWGSGTAGPEYANANRYLEWLAQATISHERTRS
jgi:exosortase